jgi:hypothetical protein
MICKIFVCIILTVLIGRNELYAQANFLKGFVVTLQGDTLKGYVNDRQWDISPTSIEFKKETNEREQTFGLKDIVSFEVNAVKYLAVEVEVEVSPYLIEKMDTISTFTTKKVRVFIKQLVSGPKSLYRFADKNDHPFYYIFNEGQFELLKHKRYFRYHLVTTHGNSAKKVILENKAYLAQVVRYLSDCMDVNRQLQYTKYDQRSLIELFELYYRCRPNSKPSFHTKNDNYRFEMGPLLYLATPSLSFSGANFARNYPVRTSFTTSSITSIGFAGDFVFKNANRKFTLGSELIYNSLKATGNYTVFVTNDDYEKYTTQVDISIVRLNTIFRMSKNIGKVDISALTGLMLNFMVNQQNYKTDEIKNNVNTPPVVTTKKVELFSGSLNTGIIVGAGLGYKRYRADFRYEIGLAMNGPIDLIDLGTTGKINSLALVFGYKW